MSRPDNFKANNTTDAAAVAVVVTDEVEKREAAVKNCYIHTHTGTYVLPAQHSYVISTFSSLKNIK